MTPLQGIVPDFLCGTTDNMSLLYLCCPCLSLTDTITSCLQSSLTKITRRDFSLFADVVGENVGGDGAGASVN